MIQKLKEITENESWKVTDCTRVKEKMWKLKELLTACFARDPLYCKLIPDEDTKRLDAGAV